MPEVLISDKAFLPDLETAAFTICLHMAFPLHVMNSEKEIFGVSSSFHKNTIPIPITTLYLGTHLT